MDLESGLTTDERDEVNKSFLWKLGYDDINEFAKASGYDSAVEMAREFNYHSIRDFFLSHGRNPEIVKLQELVMRMNVFGDKILRFNEFVANYVPKLKGKRSYAENLFGDRLEDVVGNTLEFYRHYQPTRPICSVTVSDSFVEEHRRDSKYVVTDISEEGKKMLGFTDPEFKLYKIEEKINYTSDMMLKDVEYNAKIAYVLAGVVGSRDVYEVGAGNGGLALGLSLLSPGNIITIESDPYYFELQRKLCSKLIDKIEGKLIIEDPIAFGSYIKKNKINSSSFLVCSRGDWKLFDEVVNFGINNSLDMFVSRDFHSQQHMFAPIMSAPLDAYNHVKEIIFNITKNSVGHQMIMTRKDLGSEDEGDHTSHFNEFLIKKVKK